MSGRYERVNTHNDDDIDTPTSPAPPHPVPDSPPPSFHSRASSILSSRERREQVDPALADAFDAEDDDSEDEADDRQRLVRGPSFTHQNGGSSTTSTSSTAGADTPSTESRARSDAPPPRPPAQTPRAGASNHHASRVYGSGIQSDGVFSNLTAKPERAGQEEKEEQPPTYEQAAADAAPPYWETTILAPGLGGPEDVYIDGMPVGSLFSFVWNGMISVSFQIVGFLLTYLLHSTHAAKNGSRAGLGITLIQYGFYMKGSSDGGGGPAGGPMDGSVGPGGDSYATPPSDPNAHDFDPGQVAGGGGGSGGGGGGGGFESGDWIGYVLMVVGWFILIRAVSDYLRARRHEQLVLQSPDRGLGIPIIAEGERSETVV